MTRRTKRQRLEAFAYHEAGHAVMFVLQRLRFLLVTMTPDGEFLARIVGPPNDRIDVRGETASRWNRQCLWRRALAAAAGPAAQELWEGPSGSYALNDRREVLEFGQWYFLGREGDVEEFADRAYEEAQRILRKPANWSKVKALAEALLEKKTIRYREARRIVLGPRIVRSTSNKKATTSGSRRSFSK